MIKHTIGDLLRFLDPPVNGATTDKVRLFMDAAAAIMETDFTGWCAADMHTVYETYSGRITAMTDSDEKKRINAIMAESLQRINAVAFEKREPDMDIVPGQTVYTVQQAAPSSSPAVMYSESGRILMDGEWPPLDTYKKPSFPLDVLPGYLQEIVQALHCESGAPVDYYAGLALSVGSLAVFDRGEVILAGNHRQPLSLYTVIIGGSGSMKSTAFSAMQQPLIEWIEAKNKRAAQDNKWLEQKAAALQEEMKNAIRGKGIGTRQPRHEEEIRADIERLEEEKRPMYPSPLTDATMESIARQSQVTGGAVSILSDEGQMINAIAGRSYTQKDGTPNIDVILKGYDSAFVHIVRHDYSVKGKISLAMCIGAQPTILETLLTHGDQAERGFPQRCLFYYPEPNRSFDALALAPCPYDLKAKWRDVVQDLLQEGRGSTPIEMVVTPEALQLYQGYRNAMNTRMMNEADSGTFAGWISKAHDKMARVAAILALLENPKSREVTVAHVYAAMRLFDQYVIPIAEECYGMTGYDLPSHLVSIMGYALKEKAAANGIVFEGALWVRMHQLKRYRAGKSSQFEKDMRDLEERGYIRRVQQKSGVRGGRPSVVVKINPSYIHPSGE